MEHKTYFYYLRGCSKNKNEEVWLVEESNKPFPNYKETSLVDPKEKERLEHYLSHHVEEVRNSHHIESKVEKFNDKGEEIIISVRGLTKDYGNGRGIFDISFDVPKGCVFGYCGTNGSGKTTTLRNIMGFIKPDKGCVYVKGLDAWKHADEIKQYIGYLPGEIAFPAVENGSEFLKIQAESIGLTDMSKAEAIINALQLDPTANLKRMSKGMKQKTAIAAAFMHSPEIIILDEPTTGLDPLMRDVFVHIIKAEKARGATIIMSNHMFDELEETCDYVGFIKDGHLIDVVDMKKIKDAPTREYVIGFEERKEYEKAKEMLVEETIEVDDLDKTIAIKVDVKNSNELVKTLRQFNIKSVIEKKHTLEEFFVKDIGGKEHE